MGIDGFQGEDGCSRAVEGHHRTSWIAMNHFLGNNNYRHLFFDDWNEVNKVIYEDKYLRTLLRQKI